MRSFRSTDTIIGRGARGRELLHMPWGADEFTSTSLYSDEADRLINIPRGMPGLSVPLSIDQAISEMAR